MLGLSASYPPLPDELAAFAETGVSMVVGTCSKDLRPDSVRCVGVRVWPGACQLTVLVPAATGATSIANLRENPRLALTLSSVPTHRTVQLKGTVRAIRDGDEHDRELATRYRALFAEDLAWTGLPKADSLRLGMWPCFAVDLEIEVVYAQTPGPSAGVKLPLKAETP